MVEQLAAQLGKVGLFEDLPKRHLKGVARLVEVRQVPKGEVLVREGTHTREFFVVFSGSAAVTVRGQRRDTIGPGEFFGELAILGHSARTATVTAIGPMRVGVIGARAFQDLLESEPRMALHMLQALSRRLEHLTVRPAGELR